MISDLIISNLPKSQMLCDVWTIQYELVWIREYGGIPVRGSVGHSDGFAWSDEATMKLNVFVGSPCETSIWDYVIY